MKWAVKNPNIPPITRCISETVQDIELITMDVLKHVTSDDLE